MFKQINMSVKLKENLAILIYARLNSKRMPSKVLTKINSRTLLSLIIERIKTKSKFNLPIIVCTSKKKSDNRLVAYCKKKKISFFRGDLNNVLKRTIECSKTFHFTNFIRVCADRPFFDVILMDRMIRKFNNSNYDIITNQFPRTYPKGLACEIAKINIFKELNLSFLKKNEKEHIFDFFYKKNEYYKIYNFSLSQQKQKMYKKDDDWSINEKKDLIKIRKFYKRYQNLEYIDLLSKEFYDYYKYT